MNTDFRCKIRVAVAVALVLGAGTGCATVDSAAEAEPAGDASSTVAGNAGDRSALPESGAAVLSASEFDLDSYEGKVVILNFWATWCGPCQIEIPSLVRLRDSFDSKQVAIVGVSLDVNGTPRQMEGLVKDFAKQFEINYPLYLDSDHELAMRFDKLAQFLPAIPATLVFDQTGEIRYTHRGIPRNRKGKLDPYSALGEQIQELLDGA